MQVSRREFLQSPALLAQPAKRPNVLWIMVDQLRFDCLGANGNRLIRTPHLDRLAARSANYQMAFVQAPVCVPSRASYFTGRYPHAHNRVNYTPLDARERLGQQYFRDAGYRTGVVGKLHYYPPTAAYARSLGWDHVQIDDGVGATDPYSDYVVWRKRNDPKAAVGYQTTEGRPGKNPFRAAIAYDYTPTAWTGAQTRRMLREFGGGDRPFFLYASFFKPHSPHTVPEPYDAMYDDIEIPLPRAMQLAEIEKLPLPVQRQILRGKPVYGMERERLQWIYRSYYGGVSMIDREVGLILEELERSGQASDTILVFATDHGDQLLEHGLEGKNVFFEASVRVPFLLSYPEKIRAGLRQELVEMVDVLPTLLELCGIAVPSTIQGRSIVSGERREFVFSENVIPEVINSGSLDMPYTPGKGVGGIVHPDAKMIRTARWKYNHYPGHGGELYDLRNDAREERNLYEDAGHRETVREMKERLLDFLIVADETDQIAPRWLLSR